MLQEKRFANTVEYLKFHKTAKISELAKLNHVSVDTVRRDLEVMEGYGVLEKVRGGAIWREESLEQHVYEMRTTLHKEEKVELSKLVNRVLDDGKTVILGSGSTTVQMAREIAAKYKKLTVITNDLDIVKIMSHKEGIRLIVLGGLLDMDENAVYGIQCENEIQNYNADMCILAVNGISAEKGVSDFRLNQLETFKRMMEISQDVVIAADNSKFGRTSCMKLCDIDEIDYVLCDGGLEETQKQKLQNKGITVITE